VSGATFPFGAHVAVVEVDTETGQVKHLRHIACDDAGKVLNPMLLEGQIHGGVAQGTAQALLEEVRYDEDGNPITSNLADYAFISAAELPSVEVVHMETPTFINPSARRASARAARSARRRPCSPPSSTRSATSGSATSTCRPRPRRCGTRSSPRRAEPGDCWSSEAGRDHSRPASSRVQTIPAHGS
jgi:hypothetical protein